MIVTLLALYLILLFNQSPISYKMFGKSLNQSLNADGCQKVKRILMK